MAIPHPSIPIMNILSISAFAHLYAIVPFILYGGIYDPLYSIYCIVIMMTSLTYALLNEMKGSPKYSPGIIMLVDYVSTMTWFTMDIYVTNWRCDEKTALDILQMNNAVLIMYVVAFYGKPDEPGIRLFVLNSISAIKSILVSYLIVQCS